MTLARFMPAIVLTGCALAACGKTGPPLPPEPRGPLPPRAVAARQIGRAVVASFLVPRARGDKPGQQPVRAELVRVEYERGQTAPSDPDAFRRRGATVATVELGPLQPGDRIDTADPTLGPVDADRVGLTLRYGVRVLDRRGRPSPLVVARDLVTVEPPQPPSALAAEATGDGVRLTWAPPPVETPRFNIYRTDDPARFPEQPINGTPVGSTEFLDTEVVTGGTYSYVVRTAAADGPPFRESSSTAPVVVVAEDRFAPRVPGGLVAVQEGEAVRLFWNPNEERDLRGYRVYRRPEGGEWQPIGPEVVDQPLYLDDDVRPGQRLEYAVSAIDRANPPNESERSSPIVIDVAVEPATPGG